MCCKIHISNVLRNYSTISKIVVFVRSQIIIAPEITSLIESLLFRWIVAINAK
jgi:hypothetical protein